MNLKNIRIFISIILGCVLWQSHFIHPMFELEEEDNFPHELYPAMQAKDCNRVERICRKIGPQAINGPDRIGKTVLAYAIEANAVEIVKILLTLGAKVNQKSTEKTPLMLAVERGKLELVQMLINFGAHCDDYETMLLNAIQTRNIGIVKLCLKFHASNASEIRKKVIADLKSRIVSYKQQSKCQWKGKEVSLHEIIDDYEMIRALIIQVEASAIREKELGVFAGYNNRLHVP